MHVSSSFATAREYAGDTVILYFRIREEPNVVVTVVVTVSLVIYVFSERIQPTQGGSVPRTRGPFYRLSALVTLARSARRHARRSVGIRLTVHLDDFASATKE